MEAVFTEESLAKTITFKTFRYGRALAVKPMKDALKAIKAAAKSLWC